MVFGKGYINCGWDSAHGLLEATSVFQINIDNILYYTGQNPQQLIYGNKILYDCYSDTSKIIHLFRAYKYYGIADIYKQPYQENGKWIFPLIIEYNYENIGKTLKSVTAADTCGCFESCGYFQQQNALK